MGHACNTGCNNYFEKLIPDTGVKYTGPAIPSLGICTGDFLSEIESVLLQKIIDFSTGVGISIPSIDLTTCVLFSNDLVCCNTCTDLPCLMQAYLTAICTLYGDFTTLQTEVNTLLNGPYNTACLTLGANPTLTQIIQELILEFCSLVQTVTMLSSQVTNFISGINTTMGNYIGTHITSQQGSDVLNISGIGATTVFDLRGFIPIGGILPYAGPVTGKFDSTGLGLTGHDVYGFALTNGNNNTVDLREQFIVGVGHGIMGGSGNGPSNINNSNYGLNSIIGSATVTLTSTTIPSVGINGTITVNDPGHSHGFFFRNGTNLDIQNNSGNNYMDATGPLSANTANPPGAGTQTPISVTAYIQTATTGINITTSTLSTMGTGGAHENRPPSTALYYIQRII